MGRGRSSDDTQKCTTFDVHFEAILLPPKANPHETYVPQPRLRVTIHSQPELPNDTGVMKGGVRETVHHPAIPLPTVQ